MAALDELRRATNEPADDTDYDNVLLQEILTASGNKVDAAAAKIWKEKAAKFAQLVDMKEGETARDLSDLSANALRMAKMYQDQADASSPSGHRPTAVGRITRA